MARREHIAIHYFVDLMPAAVGRFLHVFQLALVNLAIVWYAVVWIAATGSFLMPALQLPPAVAQLSVAIGGNLPECLRGDFGPGHRRDIPGRGTLPAGQFHNADADLRIPRSGTLGTGDLDGLRRHRMLRFVDDAAQPASPECYR